MDNEKRISEILSSMDNLQKVDPSPYLFSKIQARSNESKLDIVPVKWAFTSLVSLTVIFLIVTISLTKKDDKGLNESQNYISEQQEANSEQLY
jgi:hypothetical protein